MIYCGRSDCELNRGRPSCPWCQQRRREATSWHTSTCASQDRTRQAPCDCQQETPELFAEYREGGIYDANAIKRNAAREARALRAKWERAVGDYQPDRDDDEPDGDMRRGFRGFTGGKPL